MSYLTYSFLLASVTSSLPPPGLSSCALSSPNVCCSTANVLCRWPVMSFSLQSDNIRIFVSSSSYWPIVGNRKISLLERDFFIFCGLRKCENQLYVKEQSFHAYKQFNQHIVDQRFVGPSKITTNNTTIYNRKINKKHASNYVNSCLYASIAISEFSDESKHIHYSQYPDKTVVEFRVDWL